MKKKETNVNKKQSKKIITPASLREQVGFTRTHVRRNTITRP